jgi:hypothetical protein
VLKNLLVALRDRPGRNPGAPQGLGDVLDPAHRAAGQVHREQRLLDRALAPAIALDLFLVGATKNYSYIPTQVWLAATYARLGELDQAEWAAEQIRILMPEFSVDEWMRQRPYRKPEHREALITGLRLAGLR